MSNPHSGLERNHKFHEWEVNHAFRSHSLLNEPHPRAELPTNKAANDALPKVEWVGNEQNTLARNDSNTAKADPPEKSDTGKSESSDKAAKSKVEQSENSKESKSESSNGQKKSGSDEDRNNKPLSQEKNADGSTTEHYLDGHSVTKYPDGGWKWQNKPGDYVQTVERTADGKTRITTSDGTTTTDDPKHNESTYSDPRANETTRVKNGQIVYKGPYQADEKL